MGGSSSPGTVAGECNKVGDDDDPGKMFFRTREGCLVYRFLSESIVATRKPIQLLGKQLPGVAIAIDRDGCV